VSNQWRQIMKALFLLLCLSFAGKVSAQPPALDPVEATKLAERMCRQLPNVAIILEKIVISDPTELPKLQVGNAGAARDIPVTDDVYDTLVSLGSYSIPCLVDRLTDARWMPDPRSEPLLGAPVVGDVAYMILLDKGVDDILPSLARKREMRMDEYFIWPSIGNHRPRLQAAVRAWLRKHPNCCAAPPITRAAAPAQPKFRMSPVALTSGRTQFARLRPGMTPAQALRIAGKPDAMDHASRDSGKQEIGLLGYGNNNETLAYLYFIERWSDNIATRDPLRDRYVIVYFSGEGKLTRVFSNVASIPPMFPSTSRTWMRLMWGWPPIPPTSPSARNR